MTRTLAWIGFQNLRVLTKRVQMAQVYRQLHAPLSHCIGAWHVGKLIIICCLFKSTKRPAAHMAPSKLFKTGKLWQKSSGITWNVEHTEKSFFSSVFYVLQWVQILSGGKWLLLRSAERAPTQRGATLGGWKAYKYDNLRRKMSIIDLFVVWSFRSKAAFPAAVIPKVITTVPNDTMNLIWKFNTSVLNSNCVTTVPLQENHSQLALRLVLDVALTEGRRLLIN